MQKRFIVPVAAILVFALVPFALRAAGKTLWDEATALAKLGLASGLLSLADQELAFDPIVGGLDDDTFGDAAYMLRKDVSYTFLSVCDSDCRILSLTIYDEDRHVVAECKPRTAGCMLSVKPRRGQQYLLRSMMLKCAKDPCYYAVGVYN
jgi:hypothetical protein